MSEWVDINEKLPEDDQLVLMCDESIEGGLPMIGRYCEDFPAGFYDSTRRFRIVVSHWIPYPKFSKAKDE